MRFSIQEDGKIKKFFHTPNAAQKETGLNYSVINSVLKRNNTCHLRRSDSKIFFIQKEPEVKILTIEGEDFFSLEEIQQKFGLSPTKIINQLKNQKFPQKIDWISPEIFPVSSSNEISEVEILRKELEEVREEMKKEFASYQESIRLLFDALRSVSARVLELEKEKNKSSPEKELKEQKSSPKKIKETSSGEKIPFDTSKKFSKNTFFSVKNIAEFIRFGILGQMAIHGPRKNKTVVLDGKIIYVPDLVREIISSHIKEQMFQDGNEEAQKKFIEGIMTDKKFKVERLGFIRKIRQLDEATIHEISLEFMKYL